MNEKTVRDEMHQELIEVDGYNLDYLPKVQTVDYQNKNELVVFD
jgi:hypothetical protein